MSEHSHEHTHTYTHEHPHSHEHGHENDHNHVHDHEHEHEHDHVHDLDHEHSHDHHHQVPETPEKMTALLDYMCKHNESHEDELKKLSEKLRSSDRAAVADKVDEACEAFSKGNAALRQALDLIKNS